MSEASWIGLPIEVGMVKKRSALGFEYSSRQFEDPCKVHAYPDQCVYPDSVNSWHGVHLQLTCPLKRPQEIAKPH